MPTPEFLYTSQSSLLEELLTTPQKKLQEELQNEEVKEQDILRYQHEMTECSEAADNLYKNEKYANAIIEYNQAIQLHDKIRSNYYFAAESYQKLAGCYLMIPKIDEAIRCLQESLKNYNTSFLNSTPDEKKQITVKKVDAYFDLATIYKNKNKLERAAGFASEGLRLNETLLSDMRKQVDLDRNAKGLAIITDCRTKSPIPHPIASARTASDKENESHQNSPPVFKTLKSSNASKQIEEAHNPSSPRSPLLESSVFNIRLHLPDSDQFKLDDAKESQKQAKKQINSLTKS